MALKIGVVHNLNLETLSLWFQEWHEELGKLSLKDSKV